MHGIRPDDHGRRIDWGETSADYSSYRPGYPRSFYERIARWSLGRPGQRVLDLGTGTGTVARELARRGCEVTAVDLSARQIAEARRLAREKRLQIGFLVRPAEQTGLPAQSFEWITAAQCWLYFDRDRTVAEVRRLLAPGGRLLTCHMCWLPRSDAWARRTEQLVLAHNPDWAAAGFDGEIPARPDWVRDDFEVTDMFHYDEPIPFTRETWRGRIRACRGVGATLTAEQVAAFDREHAALLEREMPERFTVLHRIDAHSLRPRG